jgi:two-component system chemotaxis sensor kinase CheA
MNDPMMEMRASFFVECEELLEALQDGLAVLEAGEEDNETVNVVFRAVHSIKGGAGAFALHDLVRFAHRFETMLDELRSGVLTLDPAIVKLAFSCADLLADLVRSARDDVPPPLDRVEATMEALDEMIAGEDEEEVTAADFQPVGLALDFDFLSEAELPPTGHVIRFRPTAELYATGNEPRYLLKALAALGPTHVTVQDDGVPTLDVLDPEASHLGWEVRLAADVTEAVVREVFEFVEGLCELDIRPPDAASSDGAATAGADQGAGRGASLDTGFPGAGALLDPADRAATSWGQPIVGPDTARTASAQVGASPVVPQASPRADARGASAAAPAAGGDGSSRGNADAAAKGTIRVDIDRIDRLVNLVGELVINQAMLAESVHEAGLSGHATVESGLNEFMQLTRDIQESVMLIRAQPIKSLFQRMGRIVREASAMVGKDVHLRTEGEATEVDKTVIERLADPLTHMIRNAVDHGVESPDRRVANGKPRMGEIRLSATHRSGRVLIEVADDGAGIDRPKVLAKAISRGLVEADAQLTDAEIDNLLFLPGFSTADQVSDLSGRGVGMDVVRSAIQALGGRVVIQSEPGRGTTFSISLPLTLAVLDGMVVRVAGETLVVPLSVIEETMTVTEDGLSALGPESQVLRVRQGVVPLYDLGVELNYRAPIQTYAGRIALLVTLEDGRSVAIAVDRIEEQRQVVIKGLHSSYGRIPGIAAATILGNGQIALILDIGDLVGRASGVTRPQADLSLAG